MNYGEDDPITNTWIAGNTVESSGGAAISIIAAGAVAGPAEIFNNTIYDAPVGIECFADGLANGNTIRESDFALGTVCNQVLDLSSTPDHLLGENFVDGLDSCNLRRFAHLADMMQQQFDWTTNKERIAARKAAYDAWKDEERLPYGR